MPHAPSVLSRRRVLQATGATLGGVVATTPAAASHDSERCPDATIRPNSIPYDPAGHDACSDDHPYTETLQSHAADALADRYATVGDLIEAGYLPYFDFFTTDPDAGVSHWLNPEFIGDRSTMHPGRPEAVVVDHRWWRPIGAMFLAVRGGVPHEEPPPIYTDGDPCLPWHAHVGLPGRYAWWTYLAFYSDGDAPDRLPCRTPWMTHVWRYDHPGGVYAKPAPPRSARGGSPAEPAGFETDVDPEAEPLSWEVLPDALKHRVKHH